MKSDLGDVKSLEANGFAGLGAESKTTLDHPGRQQITDQRHQVEHRSGCLLGGFTAVLPAANGASFQAAIRMGSSTE